jgi:hypothetical protein
MGMVVTTKPPLLVPIIVVDCDTLDLVLFLVWSLLYLEISAQAYSTNSDMTCIFS